MAKLTRSKIAVAEILLSRPTIKQYGFAAELRRRWPDNKEIIETASHVIPAAFEIHEDEEVVAMIEVIDDNPIRADKAQAIFQLALALDDVEWSVNVVCFDYEVFFFGLVFG